MAPALYLLVYVATVAISFPVAGFLTIAGGFLFGAAFGAVLAWAGATLGATIVFLVARTSFGDLLARRAGPRTERLRRRIPAGRIQLPALPSPRPAISVLAGQSRRGAVPHAASPLMSAATAIGILPATFVFAYFGEGLADDAGRAAGLAADPDRAAAARDDRSRPGGGAPLAERPRQRTGTPPDGPRGMNEVLTPDICVIGAGSAGLTLAAAAASLGVSVVLIEKGTMGGECLNNGCVPSKALIAAARQLQAIRTAARLGIAAEEPRVNFSAIMDHVRGVVAAIAPNDSAERFTGLGVTVLRGEAKFVDRGTVAVEKARVHARRFVIATGSRPAVPDIPGLATVPFLTNETVFSLKRLPARLVVIGGGASGLELAQAFRRLGSEVTVLEARSRARR